MLQMLMVNTLDHQTALTLQHSLQSITNLMALQAGQLPAVQLGLCGVVQQSQDVRLQVSFQACKLLCCSRMINEITAAIADDTSPTTV